MLHSPPRHSTERFGRVLKTSCGAVSLRVIVKEFASPARSELPTQWRRGAFTCTM